MPLTTIVRDFEFDAAHRVLGHEGKCKYLHGHRYKASIRATCQCLDNLGRVIDFGEVKRLVGGWIDNFWDHNTILNPQDPILQRGRETALEVIGQRPYIMPETHPNPTAENLAQVLFNHASVLLQPTGIEVVEVVLHETPNCRATFTP